MINLFLNSRRPFIIGAICLIGVFLCSILIYFTWFKSTNMHKYLIIDEIVHFNGEQFIAQSVNLTAINLGRQIGVTDEKHQVYEIIGQKNDEFICIRHDGLETVYKESNVPYLIVERFNTDKIVQHHETQLSGQQVTISQKDVITKVLSYIKDENIVNDSGIKADVKKLKLYSEKFPGLCFILYYLHDEDNGNCFIYDPNLEKTWKIGHELMSDSNMVH